MNQTMNDACKRDFPNLHEWCQEYAKKTGVNVYAANPPVALILEEHMGKFKQFQKETMESMTRLMGVVESLAYLHKKEAETVPAKKEKSKK